METKAFRDTTHKLVHGHEGWMEDFITHYHAGDPIMVTVNWGHNCQKDGLVNIDQMTYTVCAPDGTISEVKAEISDEEAIDLTAFDTPEEGFYTFIAEYNNCWAKYGERDEDYKFGDRTAYPDAQEVRNYHQYATMVVPVGHFHENEMYQIPSMEISILPTTGMGYEAGHTISFQIIVQGKPGAKLPATLVHLTDDGTEETQVTADENGVVTICPEEAGTYCMIVRATDETKDPDGKYEATSFTATHAFRVAEHHHHDHDHHHHHDHDHEHHDHDHDHHHE
ncbi:MAG: DUF4198 domain-containing protein [Oscillospiraceae bacterium]|nr:DUF4198 domain-containing protein [Oscillospiraceae bacterium]